jgi:GTP-binding protein
VSGKGSIVGARFVAGASSLASLPETDLPEIAFVGRSNVGKSTLINRITGSKSLARTSSTPGRTQELNFFEAKLRLESSAMNFHLVDLPGFGYAKFSKKQRQYLSRLTVEYLSEREQLQAVCLLNDCRRTPGDDEIAIRNLAYDFDLHLLVVATKFDKLKQKEQKKCLINLAQAYGLEVPDLVVEGEKLKRPSKLIERMGLLLGVSNTGEETVD